MSWPTSANFDPTFKKPRKRLERWTKAQAAEMRADRLRRRFDEWLARLPVDSGLALKSIIDGVSSPEFAAWYEGKTGRDSGPFVGGLSESLMLAAHDNRGNAGFIDLIRHCIAKVDAIEVVDLEWLRSVWAEELQQAKGGQRRRILMRLATPKWANPVAMLELYALRDELSITTGVVHHVDHIVPIQHPYVCGLNCEANLRVVTATENLRKRNHFAVGG